MCPCPPLLKIVFVVRGRNNVPGNKYFSKSKSQSCHNRVLERASASLALDDADGLLLLLTFCIAEVGIFEKRPPGGDANYIYDDEGTKNVY